MGKVIMSGGGGGVDLDVITATAPYIFINKENVDKEGEPLIGTMPNIGKTSSSLNAGGVFVPAKGYHDGTGIITANTLSSQTSATATENKILSGYTGWVNGSKITGNITNRYIQSFSAEAYSSTTIIFTWKNPTTGPYSGIIIVGKTGSYPTNINDGNRYYKGAGTNVNAGGMSSATVTAFYQSTTYYFRAFSYVTKDNSEWIHANTYTAFATTTSAGSVTFTASTSFTVPTGVRNLTVFCVGGGGSGGSSYSPTGYEHCASGGGGGYTTTQVISVTPGQVIPVIIGYGGSGGLSSYGITNNGGATSFGSVSAKGGYCGSSYYSVHRTPTGSETPAQLESSAYKYSDGGTGGGGGGVTEPDTRDYLYATPWGAYGGSDGGNGGMSYLYNIIATGSHRDDDGDEHTEYGYGNQIRYNGQEGGRGQGYTTRAFGEANGTIYAGAGGGSGGGKYYFTKNGSHRSYDGAGGAGGYGGGGRGCSNYDSYVHYYQDAAPNSGGGGGGGCGKMTDGAKRYVGSGGTGICLIRWG